MRRAFVTALIPLQAIGDPNIFQPPPPSYEESMNRNRSEVFNIASMTDKIEIEEPKNFAEKSEESISTLPPKKRHNSVNSAVSHGSVKSVTSRNSAKSITSRGSSSSLDDFQIDRAAWETGNFLSREARKRRLDAALGLQSDDCERSCKRPKLKSSAGQLIKNKSKKSYQN